MGKGIALQFKRIYPEMFKIYREYCENGRLDVGKLLLYKTPHKWILNFPTKRHWRSPSRVEYIEAGLRKFVATYAEAGITSIAFPALGCGNGELDFESQVRPVMEEYLKNISLPTFIYPGWRRVEPPEHRDTVGIEAWLKSDPEILPFDEVWRDVLQVLRENDTFETLAKRNTYMVEAVDDPPEVIVRSSEKVYKIDRQGLLAFWQQLRDYGFTHRNIVPEYYRISYLTPVFEKLPYVRRVDLSTSVSGLKTNPVHGLQIIPYRPDHAWKTESLFPQLVDVP